MLLQAHFWRTSAPRHHSRHVRGRFLQSDTYSGSRQIVTRHPAIFCSHGEELHCLQGYKSSRWNTGIHQHQLRRACFLQRALLATGGAAPERFPKLHNLSPTTGGYKAKMEAEHKHRSAPLSGAGWPWSLLAKEIANWIFFVMFLEFSLWVQPVCLQWSHREFDDNLCLLHETQSMLRHLPTKG